MPFEKFSPPRLNKVYCPRFVLCLACSNVVYFHGRQLATARKLVASQEILLWMTPSETPKALQASECSELLDPMRELVASQEILLWMTPSETPKALQASECSELLNPMRASC